MAATVAEVANPMRRQTRGEFMGFRGGIFDITADNSYPTSGYSLAASKFGLKVVVGVVPVLGSFWRNATNMQGAWTSIPTGGASILVGATKDGAGPTFTETTAATSMTGYAIRVLVFGF